MRITGGAARNRKLSSFKSGIRGAIRPTSDRVREALFSILGSHVPGSRVLDLFAGTGSLGLEALSRGAEIAVFVDQHHQSLELVRKNLIDCFEQPNAKIIRLNLEKSGSYHSLKEQYSGINAFSLIFLDPPYEKKLAEKALTMVEKTGLVAHGGFVVAEERWNVNLPKQIGTLNLDQKRRYGETGIWIYQKSDTPLPSIN